MSNLRINNAAIFVTVLGACLGLVAAGASSQTHHTTSSVISEIASCSSATISYGYTANRARATFAALYRSPHASLAPQRDREATVVLYRNANPLTAASHILVITTLARASLDEHRA